MEILSIIVLIIVGGFAGWAATRLFKADKHNNVFAYVLLGILGAAFGKVIINFVGFEIVGEGIVTDFIVAFVGAAILIGISKFVASKLTK